MGTQEGGKAPETKPERRLAHSLSHGNIWLSLLSLLRRRGKAYAYELDGLVEDGFGYRPGRVMVYVVLYKLEAEGLIRSSFEGRRKYYAITAKGGRALSFAKGHLARLAKKL